jgi:hypothetical protein
VREKPSSSRSSRRPVSFLVLAVLLVVLVVAAIILFMARSNDASNTTGPTNSPAATATIDPRLILHPRTMPLSATLGNGIHLRGTLSPSLPGTNTITLGLTQTQSAATLPKYIDLVITMPGMRMSPIHERLNFQKGAFTGAIRLPMFGAYTAQVKFVTADGPRSGNLNLIVPL